MYSFFFFFFTSLSFSSAVCKCEVVTLSICSNIVDPEIKDETIASARPYFFVLSFFFSRSLLLSPSLFLSPLLSLSLSLSLILLQIHRFENDSLGLMGLRLSTVFIELKRRDGRVLLSREQRKGGKLG